jgi:hypothetical protein
MKRKPNTWFILFFTNKEKESNFKFSPFFIFICYLKKKNGKKKKSRDINKEIKSKERKKESGYFPFHSMNQFN